MKLFARIQDPNGPENGLDGWVVGIVEVKDEAALLALVGDEVIGEFVPAPHHYCVGWLYQGGKFIDPVKVKP